MNTLRMLSFSAAWMCLGVAATITLFNYLSSRLSRFHKRLDGCLSEIFTTFMLGLAATFFMLATM